MRVSSLECGGGRLNVRLSVNVKAATGHHDKMASHLGSSLQRGLKCS